MRQSPSIMSLALLLLVLAGSAGSAACRQASQQAQSPQEKQQRAQLDDLTRRREVRESTFSRMNTQQLAQELTADSKRGVEPFNSLPFRLVVARGPVAAADLRASLTAPDRTSFLALLALRQVDTARYRDMMPAFRIGVLVNALDSARTFNAWGLPHLYWEAAGRALIAEGRAGAQALRPLLKDCRPAPMWGSEEVLESQRYEYRLCDYAWALTLAARGEKVTVPLTPQARDRLIQQEPR